MEQAKQKTFEKVKKVVDKHIVPMIADMVELAVSTEICNQQMALVMSRLAPGDTLVVAKTKDSFEVHVDTHFIVRRPVCTFKTAMDDNLFGVIDGISRSREPGAIFEQQQKARGRSSNEAG